MKNVSEEAVTTIAEALWPWATPTPVWCRTQAQSLLSHPEAVAMIVEWAQPVSDQQESRG